MWVSMFFLTFHREHAKTAMDLGFTDSGSLGESSGSSCGSLWVEVGTEIESSVVIGGIFITVVVVLDVKETPYLYTIKKHRYNTRDIGYY